MNPIAPHRSSNARLRVLIVDDDPFQRELLSDMLHTLGVRDIASAASGEQALALVAGRMRQPDLLLCDLQMPGMDGYAFMAALAGLGFAGALMIISGLDAGKLYTASLVAQLRRFNYLGAMEKPPQRDNLAAILDSLAASPGRAFAGAGEPRALGR